VSAGSAGSLSFSLAVQRRDFAVEISFEVPAGTCFALVGPSGAGKSTVLGALAGFVQLSEGEVWLDGRLLDGVPRAARRGARRSRSATVRTPLRDRRIGYASQRPALFPHLDAAANIAYGIRGGEPGAVVDQLAAALELTEVLNARPERLSGGQRQRVSLARALAGAPEALLLDEPFAGLDADLAERTAGVLLDEASRRRIPYLLVTHDLAQAQRSAERVALIDGGRCLQIAEPGEIVAAPSTRRAAELVGYQAFVPVALLEMSSQTRDVLPVGTATVGLRRDLLRSGAPPDGLGLNATVRSVVASGAGAEAVVCLDDGSVVAVPLSAGEILPAPGSALNVRVLAAPCFSGDETLLGRWGSASRAVPGPRIEVTRA
jgi:ABC-type sulfate/molybdate transport systems ATPase subunit